MGEENISTIIGLLLFGGLGALIKEILQDGSLTLPKIKNGELVLGFLSSIIVGAAVGFLVDHSPLMAFFAGYTGFSAVGALMPKKFEIPEKPTPIVTPVTEPPKPAAPQPAEVAPLSIPEIIKRAAEKYNISYDLALAVAKCESGLNPKSRNINTNGTVDRGLYQINDYYHKDVSTEQADDPEFAANWFCKAVSEGHLSWWSASQKCWGGFQK